MSEVCHRLVLGTTEVSFYDAKIYKIFDIFTKSEFILCNFKILLQICIKIALQNYKFSKTKAKILKKFISLHDNLEK